MKAEEHLQNARNRRDELRSTDQTPSRISAIVLALATLTSLVFLIFSFEEKDRATQLEQELKLTKAKLQNVSRNSQYMCFSH